MDYLKQLIGVESSAQNILLVTTSDVKSEILKIRNEHKIIDKLKIMTESEFTTTFISAPSSLDIMYVANNNPWSQEPLNIEIAKQVSKALVLICLLDIEEHPLYGYLQHAIGEGYFKITANIPTGYKLVTHIPRVDDLFQFVSLPDIKAVDPVISDVFEFNYFLDEIEYSLEEVSKLLHAGTQIENIHIYAPSSYHQLIKSVASVYRIPIKTENKLPLLSHKSGQQVLSDLLNNQQIDLETVDPLLVEAVSQVFNKYAKDNIEEVKPLIIDDLKNTTVTLNTDGGLEIKSSIDSLFTNQALASDHFFLLGNYQDGLITYKLDTNIISDQYRANLLTCDDYNTNENNLLYHLISNASNIQLSYSKKLVSSSVEISNNLSSSKLIAKAPLTNSQFSKQNDILNFARASYIKDTFNMTIPSYDYLKQYYKQELKDNKFTGINRNYDDLQLSYTSINDFYKCSYKYYLNHILRVKNGKFDSRKVVVGNIVHNVLENLDIYTTIDSAAIYNIITDYVESQQITLSATDHLYFEKFSVFLEAVCHYMKQEEANTDFTKIERESEYEMEVIPGVKLIGKIDKIMSKINDDDLYVEIYDYKTGSLTIDVKGIEYGLDMQNMIYYLLIKNEYRNEDGDEILLGTYQHQIKQKLMYDEDEILDLMKIKGFSKQKNENIFKRTEKVVSEQEVEQLTEVVSEKVTEAAVDITASKFTINPKIIEGKNVSCNYCQYISICNRSNEDFTYINKEK